MTGDVKARGYILLYSLHIMLSTLSHSVLPTQESRDPSSEMVNKIISHAQHFLWAQAILLCLPPVALFTKKRALCISSKYRKDHFCQEPKRMKGNRQKSFFFFRGEAEGYENHLVFYFWPDFHIHGHLREVRLLWPTSSQGRGTNGDRDTNPSTNHIPSFPTPTPLIILTGTTKTLTWKRKWIAIKTQKTTKSFLLLLLSWFFPPLLLQSLQLSAVP